MKPTSLGRRVGVQEIWNKSDTVLTWQRGHRLQEKLGDGHVIL